VIFSCSISTVPTDFFEPGLSLSWALCEVALEKHP
jgi:hypothetical protein